MYTYQTTGNGYTCDILADGVSIAFLQGEEAGQLLDELERCTTDEQEQELLSQYDY